MKKKVAKSGKKVAKKWQKRFSRGRLAKNWVFSFEIYTCNFENYTCNFETYTCNFEIYTCKVLKYKFNRFSRGQLAKIAKINKRTHPNKSVPKGKISEN